MHIGEGRVKVYSGVAIYRAGCNQLKTETARMVGAKEPRFDNFVFALADTAGLLR